MQLSHGVHVTLDELIALRVAANGLSAAMLQKQGSSQSRGDAPSRQRGDGIEFEELRPYQPGDDVRAIDWRVTARRGKTSTRLYAEDRERPCYIVVDQRPSMFFGSSVAFKSVVAARIAALMAWAALAEGDRVGGLVAAEEFSSQRSRRGRQAVLQLLALIAQQNQALHKHSTTSISLGALLEECLARIEADSTVVVISDFHELDNTASQMIAALSQRSSLVLIRVSDLLEQSLPVMGAAGISNGRQLTTVAVTNDMKMRFEEMQNHTVRRFKELSGQCRVATIAVTTQDDPSQRLRAAFVGGQADRP